MNGPISATASATATITSAAAAAATTPIGPVALAVGGLFVATHLGEVLAVVGGIAATATAGAVGALAWRRQRETWRPLGPGLVSTGPRMVAGRACGPCLATGQIWVGRPEAVAVVMAPTGEITGLCRPHYDAARTLAAQSTTTDLVGRSR